jgi:BlaI family penicillinase repressor
MATKNRVKHAPVVSPAEWEIMEILWDNGPSAARDVYSSLPKKNSWEIKTVRTLLSRLVEKGAVGYDQIGNSYLYRTEFSRDQLVCGEIRNVANRILNGSVSAMFASFIREEQLQPEEIEHLRKLLDERSTQ